MSSPSQPATPAIHVAHVSTVHRSNDVRIRHKECASLSQAGFQVSLLARPDATPDPAESPGITVYDLPEPLRRRDRFVSSGRAALRILRELQPDVIHFHDPELLVFAPLFRRIAPTVIYDVHEDYPKLALARNWLRPNVRKVLSQVIALVEPLLARACSGFVLVDPAWVSRFPARPSAVCRNHTLASEFPSPPTYVQPETPHFAYVGDLTPERGALVVVEAITELNTHARLTLAGPFARDQIRHQAAASDTKNRTTLEGVIGRTRVRQLLRESTAGLLLLAPTPAYQNATATKIFEYMGAGLPMILSDTAAHRTIADDHGCALIVPFDDPVAIAQAMQRLIDDEPLHNRMSRASRAAFEQLPRWEDEFLNLLELYSELVPAPRP